MGKIKASELRIGNFVYYNGFHEEVGIVSEILKNGLHEVSPYKIGLNHRIDIYYNIDKLKPIPLTKQWLLDFEIEKHNGSDFKFKLQVLSDTSLYIVKGKVGYTFWIENSLLSIEIDYVHQFQNLIFALTNTELTRKK